MRPVLLALCVPAVLFAVGVTGRGGLEAVAVSADAKLLAVGGQNRVVYILNADNTEVKSRFWVGARVGGLAFSKDGARLVVADEADRLHLLDTATGKVLGKFANAGGMRSGTLANLAVVRDLGESDKNRLRFL